MTIVARARPGAQPAVLQALKELDPQTALFDSGTMADASHKSRRE